MSQVGSAKRALTSQRALAEVLRSEACAEWITLYLLEIVAGRDPRVTLADVSPKTARKREGAPRKHALVEQVPDLQTSMHALGILLLRRDGQPASQDKLDEMLGRDRRAVAGLDLARLAEMSDDDRARLRELMRALVRPTASGVPELPAASSAGAPEGTPGSPAPATGPAKPTDE